MITVWRICSVADADSAFEGEDTGTKGGRWTSPDGAVVYTSGSQALALLEFLVHLPPDAPRHGYVAISRDVSDAYIERLGRHLLPDDWRSTTPCSGTRAIGDAWLHSGRSLVLAVPSAILPAEGNFLINPSHRDFRTLSHPRIEPVELDPRLFKC